MTDMKNFHPKPPSNLSKESVGVWYGWGRMGNREVARESAAKGTHVQLAITFLAARKNESVELLEDWFKKEVLDWVQELLDRKQIFKASHVLNNIGLDSVQVFSGKFYNTNKCDLRDYIGNHLIKIDKLGENYRNLWSFLKIIQENTVYISKYKLEEESVKCLDEQSENWKSEIATTLFLKTNDLNLVVFLNGETLWKHLLKNNEIGYIKAWINTRFDKNCTTIPKNPITKQFRNFSITTEMLNSILSAEFDITPEVSNEIYNEFSRFGIFRECEKDNFLQILKRFNNSNCIADLYDIISLNSSTISINHFMDLLTEYCLKNEYFTILNECISNFNVSKLSVKSTHLELIRNFRDLTKKIDENTLRNNIFYMSKIQSDDLFTYFDSNPIILFAVLFFTKDFLITDIKEKELILNAVNLSELLVKALEKCPILDELLTRKLNNTSKKQITIYRLLEKHLNINVENVFDFRFNCKQLPNFNSNEILCDLGYSKEINYLFYLKQSRPSIACKLFIINQLNNKENLKIVVKKVNKLAIINFQLTEISSGCVAFLEMIGIDSIILRNKLEIAVILIKSDYDYNFIVDTLINGENEPKILRNLLESIVMTKINTNAIMDGMQLIEAIKINQLLITYNKANNLRLPELFLKYCAYNNLWLPFLIFAQIYNYPIEQLKLLIQFFKNPNLSEHILHACTNDIQIEETDILISDGNYRNYFLSKIGIRTCSENPEISSSFTSQSSFSSELSDFLDTDLCNIKSTLLQILIKCHDSADPPRALLQACQWYRNPLLAILATSYEPGSLIINWLNWLSVSCGLCTTFTNYETVAISANLVAHLLVNCVKNQFPNALVHSFAIFLPDNPLKIFVEVLHSCIKFNFNIQSLLELFKNSLKTTRNNSILTETDHEMTYLNNKLWIESTALRLLAATLVYNCNSIYEQILIVDYLCKIRIWDYFTIDCPNFSNLLRILQYLSESTSNIKLEIDVLFKDTHKAVINCINLLLEKNLFEIALKIAQIENLRVDVILIKQCQNQFDNRKSDFWQKCDDLFNEYNVNVDCVVEFYVNFSEKLEDFEKYTVLKLACDWARKYNLFSQYDLEQNMWLAYVNSNTKDLEKLQMDSTTYLYTDLVKLLNNLTEYENSLNVEIQNHFQQILLYALNRGNFWLALKLQKMFHCESSDLEIIKLAFSLAEGLLSPYQLNAEQRKLLMANEKYLRSYSNRTRTLQTRFNTSSSYSHSPTNSSITQLDCNDTLNDTLFILKLLSERVHNGIELAQNIFMIYRISTNIEIPYHCVIATFDYMKILKDALEDDCLNKLDVVHDFILVYKWTKDEIADFVCEELVNATLNYIQSKSDLFIMWDLVVDQDFLLILQLLQDNCSILGHKIYSYTNTLYKSQFQSNSVKLRDLRLIVELLIRAHDCFTADCNMEGISIILKKCQEIIPKFVTNANWILIVRLLTGVARYTEMNYIFHILMENDQFEYLLRKGSRKDNKLKIALLEYLKKYCPDNRDLYKIVALHFTLFSEVAQLWEKEAQGIVKNLISIFRLEMQNNKLNPETEPFVLLENTQDTRICLNKVMENYTHSTEFYLQGEKLTKAINAAKQAELIALQISFLNELPNKSNAICVLALQNSQIVSLISSKLSFEQSLVLIEAYNYHPDWAFVLYEQYIVKNNVHFMDGYLQHLPLTDTLAQDISRKFVNAKVNSVNEIKCMKNILAKLSSVYTKYRIASELGFTDLVEDLITSGQLVYLKDTVWKKGYKIN